MIVVSWDCGRDSLELILWRLQRFPMVPKIGVRGRRRRILAISRGRELLSIVLPSALNRVFVRRSIRVRLQSRLEVGEVEID